MFIGIIIGLVVGVLLAFFFDATFIANRPKAVEGMTIGFGIGTAFIVIGWLVSTLIKLVDKQSQKVKSSAVE